MPVFAQSERHGIASDRQIERQAALRERSRPAEIRSVDPKKIAVRPRGTAHPGSENIAPARAASASKVKQPSQPPLAPTAGYGRPPLGDISRFTRGSGRDLPSTGPTPCSTRALLPPTMVLAAPAQQQGHEQLQVSEQQAQTTSSIRCGYDAPQLLPDRTDCVDEYVSDIVDHFFQQEMVLLPRSNYMESQPDINGKMRGILVDWLVEVHTKYALRQPTLFLTIKLIDRYLSSGIVTRKRLQLVGVTALLVAAKFEEIDPPEIGELVYITDNAYSKDEILEMERMILLALSFNIVTPTEAHFFEPLMNANGCDDIQREVVQYLVELALTSNHMICYPPSTLVAAAILLMNDLSNKQPEWPISMVRTSRLEANEVRPCANDILACLEAAPSATLQAVRKKYMSERRKRVARIPFLTVPSA